MVAIFVILTILLSSWWTRPCSAGRPAADSLVR